MTLLYVCIHVSMSAAPERVRVYVVTSGCVYILCLYVFVCLYLCVQRFVMHVYAYTPTYGCRPMLCTCMDAYRFIRICLLTFHMYVRIYVCTRMDRCNVRMRIIQISMHKDIHVSMFPFPVLSLYVFTVANGNGYVIPCTCVPSHTLAVTCEYMCIWNAHI